MHIITVISIMRILRRRMFLSILSIRCSSLPEARLYQGKGPGGVLTVRCCIFISSLPISSDISFSQTGNITIISSLYRIVNSDKAVVRRFPDSLFQKIKNDPVEFERLFVCDKVIAFDENKARIRDA